MIDWRELKPSNGIQLAVLGDPISHSLSPAMHQSALDELEIIGKYYPIRVRFDEFDDCIAHLASIGFTGVNITIPHKESAAKVASGDKLVNLLSTANTLRFSGDRIEAINTDVAGFFAPIADMTSGNALVLGAGGVAGAAVYALCANGWQVNIWNRSSSRAEDLALKFNVKVITEPSPAGCSLVVNATPLGFANELPPLVWEHLEKNATVYDMVYRVGPTAFLAKAASMGCAIIDGREMLVEQGAASFEWWLNQPAPRGTMRRAVGL